VVRTLARTASPSRAPVQLDVTLTSLKQARVLVLLSCKFHDDGDDDGHGDTTTIRTTTGPRSGPRSRTTITTTQIGSAASPAKQSCLTQKSAFLASYLTGLGINYRITTADEDFKRAFRSGQYNTY